MSEITARNALPTLERGASMIGESEPLRRVRDQLRRYAGCNAPVLIEGETGTGKELAAREIHYASARSLGPFVPLNCGALSDSLLESELFGHRRGAFTDARSSEPGLVEYARGGSLFLDEIDSLSPHAQTALLRLLQNGEFRAVGERPLRTADVRIIAATNASLAATVEAGRFRRDLYYRLNPLYLVLPPLRERGADLPLLACHLLDEAGRRLGGAPRSWSEDALLALARHDWPGNVRELENLILRLCMHCDERRLDLAQLAQAAPAIWGAAARSPASTPAHTPMPKPQYHEAPDRDESGFAAAKRRAIELFEYGYLTELMQRAGGNVSRAAALSGTERRQLGKMLKRYGIERGCPDGG
ncbi:sigma-54 interaction domain-containing protein [Lysobacter enzymogenes]|uniref:sigma-54 interaction domain-containing protein n=1 Tax=Lysobacter enzymogenes TaxID=69 RepID=UPI001F619678|nr:sigma-54 dependent transcriptional regulator [Lysobacter enzymogenes]